MEKAAIAIGRAQRPENHARGARGARPGGISVFLVILFSCFLVAAAAFFAAARHAANASAADGVLQSAGRSVLSEYDRRLMAEYGILAFRGDEEQIENDIRYYAGASFTPHALPYALFRSGGEHTDVLRPKLADVDASLKGFSLYDLDVFEQEIQKAAAGAWLGGMKSRLGKGGGGSGGSGHAERALRNKDVLASLPSAGYEATFADWVPRLSNIRNVGDVFGGIGKDFMAGEYILSVFNTHQHERAGDDEHFFKHEAEYVITGKKSDKESYERAKGILRAIRVAANAASIWGDPQKIDTLIALSAAAGPFEGVALVGMVAAWAGAETHNDMLLLEAGEKVALWKSKSQWALNDPASIFASIGDAISGAAAEDAGYDSQSALVRPSDRSGLDYEGYLRIMLFFTKREAKLLRVMDLIQINMKGTYREDFAIREHYTGFRFSCIVDGDRFDYTEVY